MERTARLTVNAPTVDNTADHTGNRSAYDTVGSAIRRLIHNPAACPRATHAERSPGKTNSNLGKSTSPLGVRPGPKAKTINPMNKEIANVQNAQMTVLFVVDSWGFTAKPSQRVQPRLQLAARPCSSILR